MVLVIYLAVFMLIIGSAFLCLFLFALRKGQFDDLETPAHKILLDDDEDSNMSNSNKEVCVIGCGVSGLTSAILLQNKGYKVSIFAENIPPHTTSNIAAAVWFPYQAAPLEKINRWSKESYLEFEKLSHNKNTGIFFCKFIDVLNEYVDSPKWKDAVEKYEKVDEKTLPQGYVCGFSTSVPVVQTNIYMDFLKNCFLQQGGEIIQKKLSHLAEIDDKFKIIINCSGLGAKELVHDNLVYPIRGQIVSVDAPKVTDCMTIESGELAVAYTIKREHDVILGGTVEKGEYETTPNDKVTNEIIRKCKILDPKIGENPKINAVKVGLRPGRMEVRVEKEVMKDGRLLVHNYGHGGSGVTVSWGCAQEVLFLLGF